MSYFTQDEFKCNCGKCGKGFADMDIKLVERLDIARAIAKVSFILNSAIRCEDHNKDIGGRDKSAHITGKAVDIKADDSRKRFYIIYGLIKAGFNRIGVYDNFIHADVDETKPKNVMWRG